MEFSELIQTASRLIKCRFYDVQHSASVLNIYCAPQTLNFCLQKHCRWSSQAPSAHGRHRHACICCSIIWKLSFSTTQLQVINGSWLYWRKSNRFIVEKHSGLSGCCEAKTKQMRSLELIDSVVWLVIESWMENYRSIGTILHASSVQWLCWRGPKSCCEW